MKINENREIVSIEKPATPIDHKKSIIGDIKEVLNIHKQIIENLNTLNDLLKRGKENGNK